LGLALFKGSTLPPKDGNRSSFRNAVFFIFAEFEGLTAVVMEIPFALYYPDLGSYWLAREARRERIASQWELGITPSSYPLGSI
jgi:hypothetical protein